MKHIKTITTIFLFAIDFFVISVFIYLTFLSSQESLEFPIILLLFFIPIFVYLLFYNYYFYRYYFNGVRKIEYEENSILLYSRKSIHKIDFEDIISIRNKNITGRVFIVCKQGKYIIHTYKNSPFKTQGFDYQEMKRKLSEKHI